MTLLLDTSALCAHFLDEPGADEVDALLAARTTSVCVLTWFEMRFVLKRMGVSSRDALGAERIYRAVVPQTWVVDETVVEAAILLRESAGDRLPMADALIAGCAVVHDGILVHRDRHFMTLPIQRVRQKQLPLARVGVDGLSGKRE